MDFRFTDEQEGFRAEVRRFLVESLGEGWSGIDPDAYFEDENWPVVRRLTAGLAERGWLTLAWPREYGGQGRSHMDQVVYSEETAYFRAPTRDALIGVDLVGPTVMAYGTDEQMRRLLPQIADGSAVYCQGFSEPESGSDLASLQLQADEDGDDYVLNGSKIWTSGAQRATHCYLLARTDPNAPKHRGISAFVVEMDSPGIEVRPIANIYGIHYFNQIFFDGARVPKRNMVGERDGGWYVAATSLDFERSGVARFASNRRSLEELAELAKDTDSGGGPPSAGPVVRDRLAELWAANEAGRMLAYRVAWMQEQGQVPNKEASISKLMGSEIAQQIHGLGLELAGMRGLIEKGSRWDVLSGRLAWEWMDSISFTIRAGTSEVMRNIIATRGLGLPRG